MRRRLLPMAKAIVSIALLALVFARVPLASVGRSLAASHGGFVVAGVLLFLGAQSLGALRFSVLMADKGERVAFVAIFRAYFEGLFLNNFVPAGLGSDLSKSLRLARDHPPSAVLATVFAEKLASLLALFTLASLALVGGDVPVGLGLDLGSWVWGLTGLLWLGAVLVSRMGPFLAPFLARWTGHGEETLVQALRLRARPFAMALLLSLLFQGALLLSAWFLALAVGLTVSAPSFVAFLSLATVALMLPVSVNGLGLREWLFLRCFAMQGQGEATSLAFALLVLFRLLVASAIGAMSHAAHAPEAHAPKAQ